MKRIFITRRLPPIAKELLSKHFRVDSSEDNAPLPLPKLREIVAAYDGILTTVSEKITSELLADSPLQVISNYAVGLDNIDLRTANNKGIAVYNTPDVVTESTADMAFALLLSFVRKTRAAQDFVRSNGWDAWNPELFLGEELFGKTMGIIGFGKIGQAVARRAIGFGMQVVYYNRSTKRTDDEFPASRIRQVDFASLLAQSDYISVHVPLTPETKNLIGKTEFIQMKKQPILLNLARGGIVNTDDLVEALRTKLIRGACLDVTDPEPLSGSHPLCQLDNCLIVPHIGTATRECRYAMAKIAAENIINHFQGGAHGRENRRENSPGM